MSMESWAKREVEIACARSEKDNDGDGFDGYYEACCKSALKAFESLTEDGHSGMSINVTKSILNRLIEGKPLTEIKDTPDVWGESYKRSEGEMSQQCTRMSGLFKSTYEDGSIEYRDINRVICYDINNPDTSYHSGLVDRVIKDIYPVTMPYYPGKPFKVYCEDFLLHPENGDYDSVGILYAINQDGDKIEINRFYHERDGKMKEIPKDLYDLYKDLAKKRVEALEKKNRGL